MRDTRALPVILTLAWLAVPGISHADHVDISGSVAAAVEEIEQTRVRIRIDWSVTCEEANNISQNADFGGNLNIVDRDTGEKTYLGGVFSGSGSDTTNVSRTDKDRYVAAVLTIWCSAGGHGSDTEEYRSGDLLIPRKDPGGGGGNGGGGGGNGGGGPTDPLVGGGCEVALSGTPGPDELIGTAGGDLVTSLGGDDRVSGGDGHDCLIGGGGNDKLKGQADRDRLTGGSGSDLLVGGPGKNAYDAGSGKDRVKARNGQKEPVDCGPGNDTARVDPSDVVSGCESVG